MTSKRILEQLYIAAQIGITSKENEKVLKDYYKVVLQDLDRLEKLEKENQELKNKNNALEIWIECYTKENEKFKKAIDIIKTKKINIHLFISLLPRKYPCKGIYGLLFNSIRDEYNLITLKHFGTSLDNLLTEEEIEILKEVL